MLRTLCFGLVFFVKGLINVRGLFKAKDIFGGCPHCVMIKALDCRIVVSEFELQSHCYVHSRTNILGKGMNPLIHPVIG